MHQSALILSPLVAQGIYQLTAKSCKLQEKPCHPHESHRDMLYSLKIKTKSSISWNTTGTKPQWSDRIQEERAGRRIKKVKSLFQLVSSRCWETLAGPKSHRGSWGHPKPQLSFPGPCQGPATLITRCLLSVHLTHCFWAWLCPHWVKGGRIWVTLSLCWKGSLN